MNCSHLYIDIHTHQKPATNAISLVMGLHALGIHPWDLSPQVPLNQYQDQFASIQNQSMLAIGECGIDRRRENIKSVEDQLIVFSWHIELAKKMNLPLVVHCVHAESDLLALLKKYKFNGTLLLHDFLGNEQSVEQFNKYKTYFSFGARIFSRNKNVEDFLRLVPTDKLFLETDDQSNYSIGEVYQKASELLGIDEGVLVAQIEKNLKTFFNYSDDVSPADVIKNFAARP